MKATLLYIIITLTIGFYCGAYLMGSIVYALPFILLSGASIVLNYKLNCETKKYILKYS
jgi:hypothetical protein